MLITRISLVQIQAGPPLTMNIDNKYSVGQEVYILDTDYTGESDCKVCLGSTIIRGMNGTYEYCQYCRNGKDCTRVTVVKQAKIESIIISVEQDSNVSIYYRFGLYDDMEEDSVYATREEAEAAIEGKNGNSEGSDFVRG